MRGGPVIQEIRKAATTRAATSTWLRASRCAERPLEPVFRARTVLVSDSPGLDQFWMRVIVPIVDLDFRRRIGMAGYHHWLVGFGGTAQNGSVSGLVGKR